MAFFDDPKLLIAHLRHAFITSDDTGKVKSVLQSQIIAMWLVDRPGVGVNHDVTGTHLAALQTLSKPCDSFSLGTRPNPNFPNQP